MKKIMTVRKKEVTINPEMVFVTFTDKILSGWGRAEDKVSKRVIICDTFRQAKRLEDAFKCAPKSCGFRYVNIHTKFPYYNPAKVRISIDLYEDWASGYVMKYTDIPE